MPIIEGITAAKSALEVSKLLMGLLNRPKLDVNDIRAKLSEMLIHVVNAQTALAEAQVEVSELRHQLDDREAMKALEADLEVAEDGGFLYRKSEWAKGVLKPHCPLCWGDQRKLVGLVPLAAGHYSCAIHDVTYKTQAFRAAELRRQATKRSDDSAFAIS